VRPRRHDTDAARAVVRAQILALAAGGAASILFSVVRRHAPDIGATFAPYPWSELAGCVERIAGDGGGRFRIWIRVDSAHARAVLA
jgi:hypothetical protein